MRKLSISSFVLCFFLISLSSLLQAQVVKYDLNKYYTPDIVRNSLDVNLMSTGNLSNSKVTNDISTNTLDSLKSTRFNAAFNGAFGSFKSTRKLERNLRVDLQMAGQYQRETQVSSSSGNNINQRLENNYKNGSVILNYEQRFYGQNKNFKVVGFDGEFSAHNQVVSNSNFVQKNLDDIYSTSVLPFIGMGSGRLEYVQDARQAVYILDALSQKKVLARELTDDDIFAFSQLISSVKNKRFLDARLRKIAEITAIDSFLMKNNYLSSTGATYFTTLNDFWDNGANFQRVSGKRIETRLIPFYHQRNASHNFDYLNSHFEQFNRDHDFGGRLTVNYQYAKQLNLNWENRTNLSFQGIYTNLVSNTTLNSTVNPEVNNNNVELSLIGSYNLGYYPTSRTYLNAAISQNFSEIQLNPFTSVGGSKGFGSVSSFYFSAYYYISQHLNLSANLRLNYSYLDNINLSATKTKLSFFDSNFVVYLRYSIF